jgi:hypothetical protein
MKLPPDRALRARLTAAKCPECQRTGALLKPKYLGAGVGVFCSWCNHAWALPPACPACGRADHVHVLDPHDPETAGASQCTQCGVTF